MKNIDQAQKLVVFKDKAIRRILHENEWWFSVIDVIAVLTESTNPRRYWSDLKEQIAEKEGFAELYGKIVQLKLEASDSKMRETEKWPVSYKPSELFILISNSSQR